MIESFMLLAGLLGLWAGTELIVRASTQIAKRYQLSEMVIGLSILAIGTDLPEIVVMINASVHTLAGQDKSGILLGSAVGSAIGQFGLAMGAAGLVGYLTLARRTLFQFGSVLVGSILLLFVFGLDGSINRFEGIALVIIYGVCFIFQFTVRNPDTRVLPDEKPLPLPWVWGGMLGGFLLLIGNAELVVRMAENLAIILGFSETAVAAIIIGMGSSLPELSLSVMALWRKKSALSIGNLFGSNILDTILIPGLGALIAPLVMPKDVLWFDIPVLFFLTLVVLAFFFFPRRGLQRREAMILLGIYIFYAVARLMI